MSGNFIDSSVLIYLFSKQEPEKRAIAMDLVENQLRGEGVISQQVVQETLNVLRHKLRDSVTLTDCRAFLSSVLVPLWKVMPTQDLFQRALEIQERYQYHFYDALIVAAALVSGCSRLYSEDLQNGQRISGLTIVNPFLD